MFSTFDVLVESSLNDKAAQEFITVGWGKKETQFHGSAGKGSRKKEEIEVLDTSRLDKKISCCWRGDGEFFAVNYVGGNGRMFKVYNKEGGLQYTSEVCANLQVPIAWKPSGLWIAKPEVFPNKYSITLFERNGLKHNELVLPFKPDEEKVVNLSWSQDSEIFLIETLRNDTEHRLYLYTISNYHWFLKYSMHFDEKILYNWSYNYGEPKQLHLIATQGESSVIQSFKFDFVVNSSSGSSESDESIVVVIDGRKLLLTNFKSQMVPPPMASLEVPIENSTNLVDFLLQPDENFDSNSFFTIDDDGVINLFRCIFEPAVNCKRLVKVLQTKTLETTCKSTNNALWIDTNHMLLVEGSTINLFSIKTETIVSSLPFQDVIGNLAKLNNSQFLAQLTDGTLVGFEIKDEEIKILEKEFEKLPEFCEKVVASKNFNKISIFALSTIRKKLYRNSNELSTEVTSFTVTDDQEFLIYTTIGELKFVSLNSEEAIETRRIERGSKIVSLVKNKSQIIFQLPRGNLETITPRILSFKIIRKHLQNQEYRLAFDLLRKERINLNLLIDLNPQQFLKDILLFIEQIDSIQWLNLFLTELKDEDVIEVMYKFCKPSETTEIYDESFTTANKTAYICSKMLQIFNDLDSKKYLLPSLTCHVKNQQIEVALQMIWELKKSGTANKEADDAVKYLLYLIDINVLYNIALGMYDFHLVMFVAQKSQKDPKEYVPFLNELNKLPSLYAKYKIDCHLKRYAKAIRSIAPLCDDDAMFEECSELTKKHQLYEAALEALKGNRERYRTICIHFGDHLRIKGKLLDASLLYERGGDYKQSMACARNILDWQRCILLAKRLGTSEEEMKEMASKLANALKDVGRFKEASEIASRFLDFSALLDALITGRMYSEAILEAMITGNEEKIEDTIKPNLKLHLADAIKSIEDDLQMYLEQKQRLLTVRRNKIVKQQAHDDDDDAFSDTTSLASSQNSRNTSKTFKTSKTKRKHEKKLLNMKEGNKFEDVALVDSIWKLLHKIIAIENQQTVKELLKNAIELQLDDKAEELQKAFKNLLLHLKNTLDEVWTSEMLTAGKYPENEEEMLQYNIDSSWSSKICYELISEFSIQSYLKTY